MPSKSRGSWVELNGGGAAGSAERPSVHCRDARHAQHDHSRPTVDLRSPTGRALQVKNISSSGLHQGRGRIGRTHAYGTVEYYCLPIRSFAHGRGNLLGCFRPNGSRQVTDFVLLARTHVNEEWASPIFGGYALC